MRWIVMARCGLPLLALVAPGAMLAQSGLPRPVISRALQADPLIYDAQLSRLDPNGRFELDLMGTGLGPDDTAHPGGFEGGYVHIYYRRVSAGNMAGAWKPCDNADCRVYGGTAKTVIHLGLAPGLIAEPGSHLQFKVWVSLGASGGDDPSQADTLASEWSAVYTVDRALAGMTKPVAPKTPPVIQRVAPAAFDLVPGKPTDWTVRIYGDHLCGGQVGVVLDGALVATPGGCSGVDSDGSFLPAHTSLLSFVLPEGWRRAGTYSLRLRASDGESNAAQVVVKALTVTRVPAPGSIPQVKPPLAKPAAIKPPPVRTPE